MVNRSRRALVALTLAIASASVVPAIADTTSIYSGPTGGNYSVPTNWTPNGVPNGSTFAVIIGDPSDANVNVFLDLPVVFDTLTVDAGSALLLNNSSQITGGTITTVGSGELATVGGNFNEQFSGNITLTSGSTINVVDNSGLNFAGGSTYTNNGTINLSSAGNADRLAINGAGTVTFAGNGTISLTTTASNQIIATAASMTLDNTAAHTISGAGAFTQDPGGTFIYTLTNEGVIAALNGTLTIDNRGNVTNTGTLEAGNGVTPGTLVLENETYFNTGGQIVANAGSTVLLNNGSNVAGGTLKSNGNGTFSTTSGQSGATLTGPLTIATGTAINIVDNSFLNFTSGSVYTNNGTIKLASGGDNTDLALVGAANTTVTFGGTGSIVLGTNSSANIIVARNVSLTLDNAAGHTITGSGQFTQDPGGTFTYAITNEGTITALNGTLVINQLGGLTNTGTLRAGDGTATGTLLLENQIFTDTGSQITANAGSTVILGNASTIVGGTLKANGNGTFTTVSAQSTATLTGPLTIATGTAINIVDNSFLNFTSGSVYTNNGTITLSSGGDNTDVALVGAANTTVTFGGTGSIVLGTNSAANIIVARNPSLTLDNAAGHTITGTGQFTQDPGGTTVYAITNEGTITALNGTLVINQLGGLTNTGTLRAGDGTAIGTLLLENQIFTNTGSQITANAGSTVILGIASTIVGGTLKANGTGTFTTVSGQGSATLTGPLTIGAGTPINIVDNSALNFTAGSAYTNNGVITLSSAGNNTELALVGAANTTVTFAGTGTIVLSTNSVSNLIIARNPNLTLDNTANHTITGAGQFTQDPGGTTAYAITNEGTITGLNGQLVINQLGGVTNTGTIRAGDGVTAGSVLLENEIYTNAGGQIVANAGSTVFLGNNFTIVGGTLKANSNGTFTTIGGQAGATFTGPLTITAGTPVNIVDNSALNFTGGSTITNNGNISVSSAGNSTDIALTGSGVVSFTGTGAILLTTNSLNNLIVARTSGLTLDNTATHTIAGAGQFTQDPGGTTSFNVTNEGTITAVSGSLVFNQIGNVTNTGTLRGGDGTTAGTLVLRNDTFNNAGGLITALTGSVVNLQNGSNIIGGTLQSVANGTLGAGSITTTGGNFAAEISGNVTFPTGTQVNVVDNSGLIFAANGTYTNNGTISLASAGNTDRIALTGTGVVTFNGTGSIVFASTGNNYIAALNAGVTFDNAFNHTVSGSGQFNETNGGTVDYTVTNEGTILANVSGATLLVAPGISTANTGTFEATGGGTLNVTGTFVQDTTGTLTAGIYLVNDISTLTLSNSPAITTIGASASVELTGVNSAFPQIDNTPSSGSVAGATGTVTTNNGFFVINGGRSYTVASAFTDNGSILFGGGTFTTPLLAVASGGSFQGNGNVSAVTTNSGLIIAAQGGTLAFSTGVTGPTGTLQINQPTFLDLSAGTTTSTTGFLKNTLFAGQTGGLTLGNNNVDVSIEYDNLAFGTGNAFNKDANTFSTGGKILANGTNTQSITGTGVSNGTSTTPTLAFGNIHVASNATLSYQVHNNGAGPSILFAIQTSVNGGHLTDSRLSGTGVTPGNTAQIAAGSGTSNLSVVFSGTTDGPFSNQSIHIANNFDNNTAGTLAEQTLSISGTAYNFAAPVLANATVSLGNFHISATPAAAGFSIENNAPADGFSEKLDATTSGASGSIVLGGNISLLAPQATDNTSITAAFTPSSAGAKSGTTTLTFVSDGTGTSGLGNTTISNTTLTATANVFRFAAPGTATPNPVAFGNHHVGDTVTPIGVSVTNTAANDGFSEKLDGSLANTTVSGVTFSGNYSLIAPQSSVATVLATLNTSTPGNKSGSTTVNFVSDGTGTSGLGNTALSGQSQTLTASGAVYRLAAPATVTNINLGTIHVGDSGAAPLTVSNTAPADGFSESLDATLGGPITGPVSASTNTITVGPGGSNSTGLTLTLDTSTAGLNKTGSATVHYSSNGTGSSGLGSTALNANQSVSITANVLNFAQAAFEKDSGSGTLSVTGDNSYTLNFGNITAGSNVSALLGVLNAATAPSDTLAGAFTIIGSDFTTAGFTAFSGITAGAEDSGLSVSFSNSTLGGYSETIILSPRSQDVSFDGALANVTLTLNANVVAATPEPASLGVLSLGAAALLLRRKKH